MGGELVLSIIVPVLNEADSIEAALQRFQFLRQQGCELIVVDGGSVDGSADLARPLADQVLVSPAGRAVQMNRGAEVARAARLWFLHIDSVLPENFLPDLLATLPEGTHAWGYFTVRLSGDTFMLRLIEFGMNKRVRRTSIVTGDHGVFITRTLWDAVGGFPTVSLMEDIAISRKLRALVRPTALAHVLITSSRRWEAGGVVRVMLLMWLLRTLYFLGVSPDYLARFYLFRT